MEKMKTYQHKEVSHPYPNWGQVLVQKV